jgi:hypothetical protein
MATMRPPRARVAAMASTVAWGSSQRLYACGVRRACYAHRLEVPAPTCSVTWASHAALRGAPAGLVEVQPAVGAATEPFAANTVW